ncbi:hypothetical protein ACFFRR_009051 [Megaselia abdita]
MEYSIITLYLVALLLPLIYIFLDRRQSYWKKRGVPHLKPHFIYGNIKGVGKTVHLMDPINEIYNVYKDSSVLAGITFLLGNVYIAMDLDLIKNIMVKDFSNFADRTTFINEKDDPLTANMLNLSGKQWQEIRTKLTPTFTSGKMKFMYPTISKVANEMTSVLKEMVIKDSQINIRDIVSRFTVDVIGNCAFGIECNSLVNANSEFLEKGRIGLMKPRHGPLLMTFIRSFPKLASALRFKVLREDVSSFFMNMVKETVDYREQNNVVHNDFMNILISLKNNPETNLTLNQISAQAFLFFIAGFETSSTVLTFAVYELALNEEIQEKARSEILQALGDQENIQFDQISNLTYLNMVYQETLRKYPPAPIVMRKAKSSYHVDGTNFDFEADQRIIIPIYAIQHDDKIYPNPGMFDPNRFSPEEIAKRPSNAWMPFGDGPRNCIGSRFAKIQVFSGLIQLLTNFKFTVSEQTQVPMKFCNKHFLLIPEKEVFIKMETLA